MDEVRKLINVTRSVSQQGTYNLLLNCTHLLLHNRVGHRAESKQLDRTKHI